MISPHYNWLRRVKVKFFSAVILAVILTVVSIAPSSVNAQVIPTCIQAWTQILTNSNINSGVSALGAGICNIQQQLYTVPTYPHNADPMHNQFEPWYGKQMMMIVPPPFNNAIITPWGQLPPIDPSPGNWIVMTNGMDTTGIPILKQYASFLRFWVFSPNTVGSCAQMSIQKYPSEPAALHCAAFGNS